MAWVAIGTTVISAVGTGIAANQSKKALDGQKGIVDRLTYTPVDIEQVKADAYKAAVENATNSLALERSLTPDIAAARSGLSKSVNDQLALGGRLSPDVANQVTQASRVAGGASGGFGATPGVTAATIGTTALNLLNQRQQNAQSLLQSNPLPVTGLDPGAIASLEVSNNAAQNQFNLEKAGAQSNLINSQGQNSAAQVGGYTSALTGLVGPLIGAFKGAPAASTTAPALLQPNSTYTGPSYAQSIFGNTGYNSSLIGGR